MPYAFIETKSWPLDYVAVDTNTLSIRRCRRFTVCELAIREVNTMVHWACQGYLFDRRNIGRRLAEEWGVPSSTDEVTTCVRRFGRPRREEEKTYRRDSITGSRMSNHTGHEVSKTFDTWEASCSKLIDRFYFVSSRVLSAERFANELQHIVEMRCTFFRRSIPRATPSFLRRLPLTPHPAPRNHSKSIPIQKLGRTRMRH